MQIQSVLLNLKATSAGGFARPAPLFWFVTGALIGPFALLTLGGRQSSNLPWYFWAAIPLLLLGVITVGFIRFAHESHEPKNISISPDRR